MAVGQLMAVAAARGCEHGIGLGDWPGKFGGEIEPLLPCVPDDKTVEIRLE